MIRKSLKPKIYNYAISRLGAHDYKHGWMKSDCPICGKSQKFGIHIGRDQAHCFVCEYNANIFELIIEVEVLKDFKEVFRFLGESDYGERLYREEKVEKLKDVDVLLPDNCLRLDVGNNLIAKAARSYLCKRGFDLSKLIYKGWSYCNAGKYEGYIIIPIKDRQGNLNYYHTRRFLGNGPKYNNPDADAMGIGKSLIIYNISALYLYDRVFLCEGALNAETIGNQGIATGGKKLSQWQISTIINSPVEKIVILLDDDALIQAYELALELVKYKKIKVVHMPEKQDVNDIGRTRTLRLSHKFRYLNYNQILTKLREIKYEQRA